MTEKVEMMEALLAKAPEQPVSDVIDKNMSNANFVVSVMSYSNYGAMAQVFVIEAIRNYAETVIADTTVWPAHSLVSQDLWKAVAKEIQLKTDTKYGQIRDEVEPIWETQNDTKNI